MSEISDSEGLPFRVKRGAAYMLARAIREDWLLPGPFKRWLRLQDRENIATRALERLAVDRFVNTDAGLAYGLDSAAKADLVKSIVTLNSKIPSATSWLYQVILAHQILSIPQDLEGDVIECGCWKGASTAALSLVCGLANRRLIVCDSFQGLPEDGAESAHEYSHLQVYGYYKQGMYTGRLEEVKENVRSYGTLSACTFIPGFFSDSLRKLHDPIAFAFLDVDLESSMLDCIRYIWPLLINGAEIYTDDSMDMRVVRLWFDEEWWQSELGQRAPGYVGSGCGLPIHPKYSSLGYARKVARPEESYGRISWLYYPDEVGIGV